MVLDLKPGDIVDNRYKILGELGIGGMGSVHQARETELGRVVALKLLHSSLIADSEHQERFRREGQILAELCHPNIRRCYRFGIWQQLYPYIAMELLQGCTLASLIAQTALPPHQVLNLGLQACAGMAHAHAHGIIHRDLKPGNLMIEKINNEEVLKIVDFGLARLLPDGAGNNQHLTQTGSLIGSVNYMSPEQCLGRKADERSDIYSLGCVLYEALTGEPPLVADNPIGLMHYHANVLPKALPKSVGRHAVPKGLNAVLMKAMAKSPESRQQTMAELAQQLQLVLDERGDEIANNVALKPGKTNASRWLAPLVILLVCLAGFLFLSQRDSSLLPEPGTNARSIVRRDILSTCKEGKSYSAAKREELLTLWLTKYGEEEEEEEGACLAHYKLADLQSPTLFSVSHAVIPGQDSLEPKGESSNANFLDAEKLFSHAQKAARYCESKVLQQILYIRPFTLKGRTNPTYLRAECRSVITKFRGFTPPNVMHLYYEQLANLFSLAGEYTDAVRVRRELTRDNPLYRLSNKLSLLHCLNLQQGNRKSNSFAQYLARHALNHYDGLNHRNAVLCIEENLPKEALRFLDCCDCTFIRAQGSNNAKRALTSTPFLAEASSDRRDTDRIRWAGRETHQFILALSLIENHDYEEARQFLLKCLTTDDPQIKLWLLPCLVHNAKAGHLPIDPLVRKMIDSATVNDTNWLCNLGICALKDDPELASRALKKCAALVLQAEGSGESLQTGLLVADGMMQLNEPADAKVLLEALLALTKSAPAEARKYQQPFLYLYLSKANRASNNPAAGALLSKASEATREKTFSKGFSAAVIHEQALQYALRQEWEVAQSTFDNLVSQFSLDVTALERVRYLEDYASFCKHRGQPEKAAALEQRAEKYLPRNTRSYWMSWPVFQTEIRKVM